MKCGFAGRRFELTVHRHTGHPGQALAGEHQRPAITLLARHLGVDEDVLQLSRPNAACRAHPEAGLSKPDPELKAIAQVRDTWLGAARARFDLKRSLHRMGNARHHLRARVDDAEPMASR